MEDNKKEKIRLKELAILKAQNAMLEEAKNNLKKMDRGEDGDKVIEEILTAQKENLQMASSYYGADSRDIDKATYGEPNKFEISDIYETSVCPLAKIIRKECRKRGIEKLKVISSKEEPQNIEKQIDKDTGKQIAGTVSYIPSLAGLMIAGEVIKQI